MREAPENALKAAQQHTAMSMVRTERRKTQEPRPQSVCLVRHNNNGILCTQVEGRRRKAIQ